MTAARDLAQRLLRQTAGPGGGVRIRQATVMSVSLAGPTLGIQFAGSSATILGVARLADYAAFAGDTVAVLQQGADLLVLGRVSGGTKISTYSGNTDASNNLQVTHNAGFTPSQVKVQSTGPSGGTNQGYPVVTAITSTTFTMRYMNTAGSMASTAVSGYYEARQ